MSGCEVLGLGCLAWDQLLYVERSAHADQKVPLIKHAEQVGGTCGTALCAAARYGARAAWSGTVGEDATSRRVLAGLVAAGVDVSQVREDAAAGVIQAWIVVDVRRQSRQVYYDLGRAVPCDEAYPAENVITSAQALLIDTFGIPGMQRAARLARQHKIPVVADCEVATAEGLEELLGLADHLILPHAIASEITGAPDPAVKVARLWNDDRQAVVVTCGEGGVWYRSAAMSAHISQHFPAVEIDAVDTTGCGDVFHGVYAAALLAGLSLEDRLQHASVAAAIKASRFAGEGLLPSRGEIENFRAK